MTTPRTPWSFLVHDHATKLLDADGNMLGLIPDSVIAELIVRKINDYDKVLSKLDNLSDWVEDNYDTEDADQELKDRIEEIVLE